MSDREDGGQRGVSFSTAIGSRKPLRSLEKRGLADPGRGAMAYMVTPLEVVRWAYSIRWNGRVYLAGMKPLRKMRPGTVICFAATRCEHAQAVAPRIIGALRAGPPGWHFPPLGL